MMDNLANPSYVLDREKKVIAWNRAMEAVTGFSRERMLGTSDYAQAFSVFSGKKPVLVDLLDLSDEIIAKNYPGVFRVGDSLVAETRIPGYRGTEDAYILGRAGPLFDSGGGLIGYGEALNDISDWRNSQISLKRLRNRIDEYLTGVMEDLEGWCQGTGGNTG
jgi:PAS domain-containing protein